MNSRKMQFKVKIYEVDNSKISLNCFGDITFARLRKYILENEMVEYRKFTMVTNGEVVDPNDKLVNHVDDNIVNVYLCIPSS